jgi:cytochrome c oxidase subunit III
VGGADRRFADGGRLHRLVLAENSQRYGCRVMADKPVLDVSGLPSYAYGQRSILWWGTLGFCLIEATAFALAVVAYFYLRDRTGAWPPDGFKTPDLRWGTLNTALLLASCLPNQWVKAAAEREDIDRIRLGSIVWTLMFLQTTHIATDVADTAVLAALMFTRDGRGRRFVDVSENAFYWYFVVLTWLPIYDVVYLAPRGL